MSNVSGGWKVGPKTALAWLRSCSAARDGEVEGNGVMRVEKHRKTSVGEGAV